MADDLSERSVPWDDLSELTAAIRASIDFTNTGTHRTVREDICRQAARAALEYFGEPFNVAHISGSRVTTSTHTAYGLTIEIDAAGNATAVHFPYGATAEWE